MRRQSLPVLTGLVLALTGPASADWHRPQQAPPPEPTPPNLPATERSSTEPKLVDITATPFVNLPAVYSPEPRYRSLREAEAECLAFRFASTANLLDKERAQMTAAHRPPCDYKSLCGSKGDKAWELRRSILYYAALDDRNRSAGQALELYFKTAELEAQISLAEVARDDLRGAIAKNEELAKRGFRQPTDSGGLRRQLLDTEADLTRAKAGLIDVNSRLKGLIGATNLAADEWLWPNIEVQVSLQGVDLECAIRVALQKRAELLLLREMNGNVDNQTLPVIREYLHGANGLMGAAGGPTKHVIATLAALKGLLNGGDGERESRQSQIAQLLAARELAVAEEVRRGVADLHAKARLVALSRERVQLAEDHRRDASNKVERGSGSFLEILSADSDLIKIRNQLTVDVMGWHTARAKVREAQGVFVWECCGDYWKPAAMCESVPVPSRRTDGLLHPGP